MFKLLALSVLSTAVLIAPIVHADGGCSAGMVDRAQKDLESAQRSRAMGGGTTMDVFYAEEYLLDVQQCAGVISRHDYCVRKALILDQVIELRVRAETLGSGGSVDVEQAKLDREAHKAACEGI